jgi:hypothetical protein
MNSDQNFLSIVILQIKESTPEKLLRITILRKSSQENIMRISTRLFVIAKLKYVLAVALFLICQKHTDNDRGDK